MKWRRPGNATIGALAIFLVSFGIWLTQPQPDQPGRTVLIPGVDFEFLTTTTSTTTPVPVDTTPVTPPVITPTAPPETQPPVETTVIPVEPETTTTAAG